MNSKEAFQLVLNKIRNTSRWYEDELKLIQQDLDKLEKLEKENKELKNTILSLELDTCIPELRKENKELRNSIKSWDETAGNLLKENRKLKKAIEILKEAVDEIEIITCDEEDCYGELCLYQKINGSISIPLKTKEEYILAKEVLSNER